MAISKITLNGVTQMDVTGKTVTPETMLNGITSLKNDGTDIIGSIQSQAGSIIISDECDDLVDGRLIYVNSNLNNAYYSWSNNVCTVTTPNGAVTSAGSVCQLFNTIPDALPPTVKPGETYLVTCESTSTQVRLRIVFRDSANNNIEPDSVFTESGKVSVPANAVSWVLQIHVMQNTILSPSATIGNIHVYTMVEAVPSERYTTGDTIVAVASSEYIGSDIARKSSSDLTASGATVTAPAGYYASAATKSVASGSAGTPTASKGTVSNHAISITPSVVNATGYITGGTKTGTAVSVSASDLVSGTKNVTTYGTSDVTNYANVFVGVPLVTGTFTGTTAGAAMDVTIPYTGSGYPIAVIIYPSEGCYNSGGTFYGTVDQYACVYFLALKTIPSAAPTYTTGTNNNSQTVYRFKSSASDSTALSVSVGHVKDFQDINAVSGVGAMLEIRSSTKLSVFIKSTSYGFAKDVEYTYHVIYSE